MFVRTKDTELLNIGLIRRARQEGDTLFLYGEWGNAIIEVSGEDAIEHLQKSIGENVIDLRSGIAATEAYVNGPVRPSSSPAQPAVTVKAPSGRGRAKASTTEALVAPPAISSIDKPLLISQIESAMESLNPEALAKWGTYLKNRFLGKKLAQLEEAELIEFNNQVIAALRMKSLGEGDGSPPLPDGSTPVMDAVKETFGDVSDVDLDLKRARVIVEFEVMTKVFRDAFEPLVAKLVGKPGWKPQELTEDQCDRIIKGLDKNRADGKIPPLSGTSKARIDEIANPFGQEAPPPPSVVNDDPFGDEGGSL